METTSDRYRRLREGFATRVQRVDAEAWSSATPCEDWTASDLVAHVVEAQGMFERLVGRELDAGPAVADDPLGAFTTSTDQVQAHLEDPEAAAVEFDGLLGRTTFAQAVDRFLCFDLVVHGWDLARATGQDERIDPADVAWVRETAAGFGEAMRRPGGFGDVIVVGVDAPAQDELLAFLGRRP